MFDFSDSIDFRIIIFYYVHIYIYVCVRVCACSMQGQSKHHHGEIHYLKKYDSNFTVVYFLGIQ